MKYFSKKYHKVHALPQRAINFEVRLLELLSSNKK